MSQPAGQIEPTSSRRRFRRFWWLKWIILSLVVSLCPLLVIHYLDNAAAERALAEAVAEADRLDPGWRLEELEAARRKIPDEKNGALVVLSAHRKMPAKWTSDIDERLPFPPLVRLDDKFAKELREDLKPLAGTIAEARRMADFPMGRFAITYPPDLFQFWRKHEQMVRTIGYLLLLDGWLHLQEGKIERAWKSSAAILNTARSLGDEPLPMTQLVRLTRRQIALGLMERTLSQGEISESLLTEMQKALAEDANEPFLFRAFRGERARLYRQFVHWEKKGLSWDDLPRRGGGFWEDGRQWIAGKTARLRKDNAWTLTFNTRIIEEFKGPGNPRQKAIQEYRKQMTYWDKKYEVRILWVTLLSQFLERDQKSHAQLHCTSAALAAERFRLRKSCWPKSLAELVQAGMLKEIPIDLMDGKPLRFRRTIDGLVIYSVGAEGKYRGDALDNLAAFDPRKERPEFRLWDVKRRGQASAKR